MSSLETDAFWRRFARIYRGEEVWMNNIIYLLCILGYPCYIKL